MLNNIKNTGSLIFLMVLLSIAACKEDNKPESAAQSTSNSKNVTEALKGTPATDISDVFQFRQEQFIPDSNNVFQLKSLNAFNTYIQGSADASDLDFGENDVIALFYKRTDKEVNFKVERFDNSGEDTRIVVSTITTENPVKAYRPSFLLKIPKKDVKGRLEVRLDGEIAQLTGAE